MPKRPHPVPDEAPIRELKLYGAAGHLAVFARCPYLLRLRTLDLEEGEHLTDTDLKLLLAGPPNLNGHRQALLWNNRIADAGLARAFADLPRLTRLDPAAQRRRGRRGDLGLAGSSLIGRLHLLDLTGNQVDRGAVALAASPRAATLRWSDLTKNPTGATGHRAPRDGARAVGSRCGVSATPLPRRLERALGLH
ncbi:MAG: hypothetical protein U0736_12525 [Gemmataceae bacterium]